MASHAQTTCNDSGSASSRRVKEELAILTLSPGFNERPAGIVRGGGILGGGFVCSTRPEAGVSGTRLRHHTHGG